MTVMSALSGAIYKGMAKPLFFRRDPEDVHDAVTRVGEFLGRHGSTRFMTSAAFSYRDPVLEQRILGIDFPNPIGLAAGFDKDARLTDIMPSVGFGFMEVGSITGERCEGNRKPRLWRMPKSQALVINYGLKNDGCEAIASRLAGRSFGVPLGTSVAKTNCEATVDPEKGIEDYAKAYRALAEIGDYTTVNISCPNAFGGQPFTDPALLDRLLERLSAIPTRKPVFIKLSPDLQVSHLDEIIAVAERRNVGGYVCANLTKDRAAADLADGENVPRVGGFSGKAVASLADGQLAYLYRATRGRVPIVGCGGVFTAEDAYRKIGLGASLVQMVTGMIYEGPQVVGDINRGLARLLGRDGFASVAEARGKDFHW
ncbi:MAG TPA: quinone-dependent dihydroorotate dehydrogenase [Candidatus Binatia bacterium]|jgi:dihydroorotate dehydrogenase|nr:quinone-dependent dihydroorotate dehydrogenase [Candidatus Binatia bacterium]